MNRSEAIKSVSYCGTRLPNSLFFFFILAYNIGRLVTSPFKPLYKPNLTDFERAIADIEDRVEHIEYTVVNISLEEQRQANWFKVEKNNQKKTTLIRYLLHCDASFDEDDFSNAIPLMVKFLSKHTMDELQDLYFKQRERSIMSKFNALSVCSEDHSSSCKTEDSDEEDYDSIADDDNGSTLNGWIAVEQPTYGLMDETPRKLRSLDSIEEEMEPSKVGNIYSTIDDPSAVSLHTDQQGRDRSCPNSSRDSNEDISSQSRSISIVSSHASTEGTASSRNRKSSLNDIYVEIL